MKLEAFFSTRKIESAVAFARSGLQAIDALETAAKAKDKDAAFKPQVNVWRPRAGAATSSTACTCSPFR
jgi:hypothetical protein